MKSSLFTLNLKDLLNGAVLAGIVAFLGVITNAVQQEGFNFANYNWEFVLSTSILAIIGYFIKNFSQGSTGSYFKK
mgnify:CR=1 FL=1